MNKKVVLLGIVLSCLGSQLYATKVHWIENSSSNAITADVEFYGEHKNIFKGNKCVKCCPKLNILIAPGENKRIEAPSCRVGRIKSITIRDGGIPTYVSISKVEIGSKVDQNHYVAYGDTDWNYNGIRTFQYTYPSGKKRTQKIGMITPKNKKARRLSNDLSTCEEKIDDLLLNHWVEVTQ